MRNRKKKSIYMLLFLSFVLVTTACGQPSSSQRWDNDDVSYQGGVDDDYVLFRNANGTDCDIEDVLEGDSDCYGVNRSGSKVKIDVSYAKTHKVYITSHSASKVKIQPTAKPKVSATKKPKSTVSPKVSKNESSKSLSSPKTKTKKGTVTRRAKKK